MENLKATSVCIFELGLIWVIREAKRANMFELICMQEQWEFSLSTIRITRQFNNVLDVFFFCLFFR